MSFTKEQKLVYDVFSYKKETPISPGISILDAPAGTGKTFVVKKIYNSYKRKACKVLCPTHKAKNLFLKDRIPADTIHRFLNCSVNYDDITGEPIFTFSNLNIMTVKEDISPLKVRTTGIELIIVDESSMVGEDMFRVFSAISKTIHVLFVCDKAQIPPVGETMSPIFKTAHTTYSFTKNMRSGDSKDAHHVEIFRNNVFEKKIRVQYQSLFITKCHATGTIPGESDMLELFDEPNEPGSAVVLTFTNQKKDKWNEYIRTFLFQELDSTAPLEKIYRGEVLVFSGNRKIADESCPKVYYSSDEIVAGEIFKQERWLPYYPSCCNCEKKTNKRYAVQPCNNCNIQGHVEGGFSVKFFEFYDKHDTIWRMPGDEHEREKVKKLLAHRKKYILGNSALEKSQRNEEWALFYEFENEYMPNLSYSYSITTHKAQGSQWNHVFLDYEDLLLSGAATRDRMLYTAASRMKETLHIVKYRE